MYTYVHMYYCSSYSYVCTGNCFANTCSYVAICNMNICIVNIRKDKDPLIGIITDVNAIVRTNYYLMRSRKLSIINNASWSESLLIA